MTLLNTNFSRGAFAIAVSVLAFTAQADGAQSAPANKKNSWTPYVGLGIGYSTIDFKTNTYAKNAAGATSSPVSSGVAKGPLESLYVGIHNQYHNFLVGGEIYGYLSQQKANISSNASNGAIQLRKESIQRNYGYGLKARAGYYVNSMAVAYVHVGLENANFRYKGTFDVGGDDSSLKKSKTLMGMPVGFGFEIDATSAWKARLEYTYTKYKSWSPGNVMTAAGETASSKIKPTQHAVVLGFSYQI